MKSWKEEKSRETSREARTLREAESYISDYDADNYIKAHNYASKLFRVPLHDLYVRCCGPESKYHLGIGTFEEMAMEAFTDALENFLDSPNR